MGKQGKKFSKKKIAAVVGISVLAALAIGVNAVCFSMSDILNTWAVIGGSALDQKTNGEGKDLARSIEREGAVLVENKDDSLPLNKDSTNKVNVFGWSSSQWIYSGSGSGRTNGLNEQTDLITALNDYGIETNTELTDMYKGFLGERPLFNNSKGTLNSYASDISVLYEPNIANSTFYTDNILDDALQFSNTALVVLGRISGESNDSPKIQFYSNSKGGASKKVDYDRSYLDISHDEEDLLKYVSENYEKTIVIVNSDSELNLSFLKDYPSIDACLLVGATGDVGAEVLPELLYGDANPSGRLTDTYPYDFKTMASYANAGPDLGEQWGVSKGNGGTWGRYTNGTGLYPADGTNNGNVGNSSAKYDGVSYVDYVEDIYVGYKWYETADAEGYWKNVDNKYGKGYDEVVQYPFGYGLSYTTFEQKIVSSSIRNNSSIKGDETIDITVDVKNTGDRKGSDVVQLYLTAPYTKGGIEKSSAVLLDFGKTTNLEPGEDQEITLSIKTSDFASYDAYDKNNDGHKGYEIENGNYQVKLMSNSHTLANTESNSILTFKVDSTIHQDEDPVTGNEVKNRFLDTSSDGVAVDGSDSGQDITYMTRADFANTFPNVASENRAMSKEIRDVNLYSASKAVDDINDEDQAVTFGKNKGLKIAENGVPTELGYKLGKDYDDPQWNDVLDQITKDEMIDTTLHGYVKNKAIDSIGKPKTIEFDGPSQVGSFNAPKYGIGYPNATVLAQTFYKDLSYEYGKQLGLEAISCGYDGLYAPGMNLHRSPFGGRNYEYYSEDPYLTGIMGAYTIKGALNKGVYMYIKHLALYEQENCRDGLYTWITEQALRENYLKPFKLAVQEGEATAFMTSYNRIGATWAGADKDLLEGVLKGEWGFRGSIITDYADHHSYMNMDQALRNGGTLFMDGYLNDGTYQFETDSNTFDNALREATKMNVYNWLHAQYRKANPDDGVINDIAKGASTPWWPWALAGVDVLLGLGIATWAVLGFVDFKKKEKTGEPEKE